MKHGRVPALESLSFVIHPSAFSGEFGTSPFIPTWLLFMGATNRLLLSRQHTELNVCACRAQPPLSEATINAITDLQRLKDVSEMPVGEGREHLRVIPGWEDTPFQPRVAGKQFCFACRHFRIVQGTESQLAVTVTSLSLSPPGCDLPQNTEGPCRIHRKGLSYQGCHHLIIMTELPTASKECHAPTTATTNVARQGLPGSRELLGVRAKERPEWDGAHVQPDTHSPSGTAAPPFLQVHP